MMSRTIKKIKSIVASPLSWYKIIIILLGRLLLRLILLFGNLIDCVIFCRYKSQKLTKPIFIVGHPRSGTTFLHRFLLSVLTDYRGMRLWDMIVPSIFLRKTLNPLLPFLDNFSKGKLYDPKIHKTSLLKEETDDVALFFKSFEGLFSWLYFGAFKLFENQVELEKSLVAYSDLGKTLRNLEDLHKKNLYAASTNKKEIFSKSFSLIIDIEEIIKRIPNAKIILLLRDPIDVIPSSMSLIKNVIQNLYKFDKLNDTTKQLYYTNLYRASLFFYKSAHQIIQKQNKYQNNVTIVFYKDLKNEFSHTIKSIFRFLQIDIQKDLEYRITEQEEKQKTFRSEHIYSLNEFGLNESMIRKDFSFIYNNYDI